MGDQLRQVADERTAGAFRSLCLAFWPKIRAMLIRQGVDGKTAEDLAQDALLAVWRKAQHASPNSDDVSALVYVNARNLRIDRLKRQAVWHGYCDEFETGEPPKSDSVIATCEQRRDEMHRALENLPSEELQIIQLTFVEGLSQAEIAAKLALPLGTVNLRTRQAFHRLRGAMEGRS